MLLKLLTRNYRGDKEVGQYLCHEFEIDRDCWGQQYARAVVADPWCEFSSSLGHNCKIKKVIFNDPATIVLWNDNTKTVVKCMEGDTYSKEMGLAMCICKKVLGSQYHKVFKEWITYEPEQETKSKYKVGDKVRFWSKNRSSVGTIVDDDGSEHMQYTVETKEGRHFYCYEGREESMNDTWYIEGLADE